MDWHDLDDLCKLDDKLNLTGCVDKRGKYALRSGGFADIWEGWHDGKKVAVKVIREVGCSRRTVTKRLVREVRAWSKLHHRNVLRLLGFTYGFGGGHLASLVSPWMDGGTAGVYLKDKPVKEKFRVITEVADGLSYLHRHDVVHGDLKGDNILINEVGQTRLADFGLSKLLNEVEGRKSSTDSTGTATTTTTALMGSVRWMAKELFDANCDTPPSVTCESDVWAYGMCVLELFTSLLPYHYEKNAMNVIIRIHQGLIPEYPVGFDHDLWTLCNECWDHNPALRPSMKTVAKRAWDLELRCKLGSKRRRESNEEECEPASSSESDSSTSSSIVTTTPKSAGGSGSDMDQPTSVTGKTIVESPRLHKSPRLSLGELSDGGSPGTPKALLRALATPSPSSAVPMNAALSASWPANIGNGSAACGPTRTRTASLSTNGMASRSPKLGAGGTLTSPTSLGYPRSQHHHPYGSHHRRTISHTIPSSQNGHLSQSTPDLPALDPRRLPNSYVGFIQSHPTQDSHPHSQHSHHAPPHLHHSHSYGDSTSNGHVHGYELLGLGLFGRAGTRTVSEPGSPGLGLRIDETFSAPTTPATDGTAGEYAPFNVGAYYPLNGAAHDAAGMLFEDLSPDNALGLGVVGPAAGAIVGFGHSDALAAPHASSRSYNGFGQAYSFRYNMTPTSSPGSPSPITDSSSPSPQEQQSQSQPHSPTLFDSGSIMVRRRPTNSVATSTPSPLRQLTYQELAMQNSIESVANNVDSNDVRIGQQYGLEDSRHYPPVISPSANASAASISCRSRSFSHPDRPQVQLRQFYQHQQQQHYSTFSSSSASSPYIVDADEDMEVGINPRQLFHHHHHHNFMQQQPRSPFLPMMDQHHVDEQDLLYNQLIVEEPADLGGLHSSPLQPSPITRHDEERQLSSLSGFESVFPYESHPSPQLPPAHEIRQHQSAHRRQSGRHSSRHHHPYQPVDFVTMPAGVFSPALSELTPSDTPRQSFDQFDLACATPSTRAAAGAIALPESPAVVDYDDFGDFDGGGWEGGLDLFGGIGLEGSGFTLEEENPRVEGGEEEDSEGTPVMMRNNLRTPRSPPKRIAVSPKTPRRGSP